MAEPTVQVPVSLIERFLSLAERADEAWANGVAGDFRTMLSKPTPTAEQVRSQWKHTPGVRGDLAPRGERQEENRG